MRSESWVCPCVSVLVISLLECSFVSQRIPPTERAMKIRNVEQFSLKTTVADKCHPSNFHFVFPFSKFTSHFPFCTSTFCSPTRAAHVRMILYRPLRLIRESWIMDAHRKRHAPSLRVADAAGNILYCRPDCAANVPRRHYRSGGSPGGCGD